MKNKTKNTKTITRRMKTVNIRPCLASTPDLSDVYSLNLRVKNILGEPQLRPVGAPRRFSTMLGSTSTPSPPRESTLSPSMPTVAAFQQQSSTADLWSALPMSPKPSQSFTHSPPTNSLRSKARR